PCSTRGYALSRFPKKTPGSGRIRDRARLQPEKPATPLTSENSSLWDASSERAANSDVNTSETLRQLLMNNRALYVERQVEMLNVFLGFEQCNRYSISNEHGEAVGHIVEEDGGILAGIRRQAFATHRPFRAMIMDTGGTPLLWLRRPFSWINSRMYVERIASDRFEVAEDAAIETVGEVQQIWHPIRRKYDLYLRDPASHRRVLHVAGEPESGEGYQEDDRFIQIAKVDEPFLSWTFRARDDMNSPFAIISRGFRGFAREVPPGKYTVMFDSQLHEEVELDPSTHTSALMPARHLNLEERALILALAVNIDFDYFSRHSRAGPGFIHFEI
ncbi:Scramblase-domain-containing protein, partial [Flagelloscypha sp. PMI_526]